MKLHKNTKYTPENFKEIANVTHNNFYEYNKTLFTSVEDKVIITCPIHGDFSLKLGDHLTRKRGCRKCIGLKVSLNLRDSKEDFLRKAYILYGNKYDYSKVEFTNHQCKVEIICPKHGSFIQSINSHLSGKQCRGCAKDQMKKDGSFYNFSKESWIRITKEGYLYLIEVFNDSERFFKVGITKSIENRFKYLKNYNYKTIDYLYLDTNIEKLWELEKSFHLENQKYKHIPLKTINGSTECYIIDENILKNFKNKIDLNI